MDNKAVFAENLRKYMELSGKTRQDISNSLGISYFTVTTWVNGSKYPRIDKIERLAKYFGILKSDLIEEHAETLPPNGELPRITDGISNDNLYRIETRRFPILGEIACGQPILAAEEKELYVEAGTNIHADFCLRVKGDSMIGARIHDGDIVFIQQQQMVNNGEIAAVIIDDEATLKRVSYHPEKNLLILKAENPRYADMVFVGEELDHIRILGRAVAFQSDVL